MSLGCGCKGHFWEMCAKCKAVKPYMMFISGRGYVWGPGHPHPGTIPTWMKPIELRNILECVNMDHD